MSTVFFAMAFLLRQSGRFSLSRLGLRVTPTLKSGNLVRHMGSVSSSGERLIRGPSLVGFNNYDEAVRNFSLPIPEFFNFSNDVIDSWAEKEQVSDIRKGVPAFWWVNDQGSEIKWSFGQLSEYSKRVAKMLTGPCNLKTGDRLMVVLPKIPEWWLVNIAAIRAGVIIMSGTTQLTSKDIKYRFERSRATCIIADAATADRVDEVADECPTLTTKIVVGNKRSGWLTFDDLFSAVNADFKPVRTRSCDPSMIFFTSGTTGNPKMAEHGHASYGIGHKLLATAADLIPTDVFWCLADPGWAKTAWSCFFAPWINGACVFIHSLGKFDPEHTLKVLERYPISVFCAPPTAYRYLVKENVKQHHFATLRHCIAGGEPMNPEVLTRWYDATRTVILEIYGQTETVLTCSSYKCIPLRLGSMGKAAPGIEVCIVDEHGNKVDPNVVGEMAIRVKGKSPIFLFNRYVDDPEQTASVFKGDFYVTGDHAKMDEDGYFWFQNRKDDVIISAGYRIGPFEIENVLMTHPAVMETAVVSSPDEMRGEVVKAFVVLRPGYELTDREKLAKELQDHVKAVTAPYKYPRKVEFVHSLPKTISGKIRRVELRQNEWKASGN